MKKILFLSLAFLYGECKSPQPVPVPPAAVSLVVTQCLTDKGFYKSGDPVNLSFQLKNTSTTAVHIKSVIARIAQLDNGTGFLQEANILSATDIDAQGVKTITNTLIWTVPSSASTSSAFGVYVGYTTDAGTLSIDYQTFFRVPSSSMLTTYAMNQTTYNGLPVYRLDGGLSAEYAVEKSAEVLTSGISHSWKVSSPGQGPNPVYSTPQFLDKSVNQTVDFLQFHSRLNHPARNCCDWNRHPISTLFGWHFESSFPSLAIFSRSKYDQGSRVDFKLFKPE